MIAQTPKNMPKTKQTVAIAAPWTRLQVPEGHAFNSAILAKLVRGMRTVLACLTQEFHHSPKIAGIVRTLEQLSTSLVPENDIVIPWSTIEIARGPSPETHSGSSLKKNG